MMNTLTVAIMIDRNNVTGGALATIMKMTVAGTGGPIFCFLTAF
jgi:hypothetical protein